MNEKELSAFMEVATEIHAQLEPRQAEELLYLATDDRILFAATVLAKTRSGELVLTHDQKHFVRSLLIDFSQT